MGRSQDPGTYRWMGDRLNVRMEKRKKEAERV